MKSLLFLFISLTIVTPPQSAFNEGNRSKQQYHFDVANPEDSIYVYFETDGSFPLSFGYYDSNYNFNFVRLLTGKHETETLFFSRLKKVLIYNILGINCPYILYAGDRIKVAMSNKKLTVVSTANNRRNKDIAFFPLLLKEKNIKSIGSLLANEKSIIAKTVKFSLQTDSVLRQCLQNFNRYLDDYSTVNHLQANVLADIRKLFYNEYILNLLYPIITKPSNYNKYDDNFINLLNAHKTDFRDTSDFFAHSFRFGLYQFNKYLSGEETDQNVAFHKQYNSAKKNFSGGIKDYLLFELMKTAYVKDKNRFDSFYNFFLTDCHNESYKKYFANLNSQNKSVDRNYIVKKGNNAQVQLSEILKSKKTNLVFVDLWASWCLPCISGFSKIEAFQKKYYRRPVSFIFLSLDSNESDWKKYVSKYSSLMNFSNSYLLVNEFNSSFVKDNNITTIPRYMILDDSGKIIVQDFNMFDIEKAQNDIEALISKYEKN